MFAGGNSTLPVFLVDSSTSTGVRLLDTGVSAGVSNIRDTEAGAAPLEFLCRLGVFVSFIDVCVFGLGSLSRDTRFESFLRMGESSMGPYLGVGGVSRSMRWCGGVAGVIVGSKMPFG